MTNTLRVGLIYGGKSVEHEISLRSAQNVYEQIDRSRFDPVLIGITKEGKWYLVDSMDQPIASGMPLNLVLGHSNHSFSTPDGQEGTGKLDVVFPVLHGTDGEDGSIQGLLQTADIPYCGSGVLGSSVAMDKYLSKQLLAREQIPTSKYVALPDGNPSGISFEDIVEKVGLPFIVKPISLGSSVGVTKINNRQDYESALKETLQYDLGFLAEEFIVGRELECAILGNLEARSSDPGEIIISPKYEFYSYDAKYQDPDAVEIKVPAELDSPVVEKINDLCLQSYKALRCEDFARVDLFLTEDNAVYINEINTIPGFTNSSMFPSLWGQHGIVYGTLITRIIELALERSEIKKKLNRNYQGTAIN
jgi:D-alanine-D-alanine ligase